MSSRWKYLVVSASTCLTVLFLVGSVLGQGASKDEDTLKHIGVFSEVVARIQREYVEEPDMRSVSLGALNGMLEAIDPFASYLNADQYRDYLKNKDIKQAGVGLILSKRPGYVSVVAAIPGSPAAKAGFKAGDVMVEFDGKKIDNLYDFTYALQAKKPGDEVVVKVLRDNQPVEAKVLLAKRQ